MSQAALERVADGQLRLQGVIDMHCGLRLRQQASRLAVPGPDGLLWLDCSAVADGSSSVCLSLLLCLQRDVTAAGGRLQISGLPEELRRIAGLYGLLELLPLSS